MRRTKWVALLALIALVPRADAQFLGPGWWKAVAPASYVGIENVYGATAAAGCFSLRACSAGNAAAHSKAIQLTRATGGTEDITVLSSGDLDVSTATTFCAATTCTVTTWYDQTGAGFNHTVPGGQAAPAFTFNAIGSLPGVTFDGSTTCLTYAAGLPSINKPVTYAIFAIPQMAATHNVNYTTIDSVSGGQQGFQVDGFGTNAFYGFNGGTPTPANVATTNNAAHSVQYLQNGASSSANIDGSTTALNFSSSINPQIGGPGAIGCTISGVPTYSNFFKGVITEQAPFGFDGTTEESAAVTNQTNYWGGCSSNLTLDGSQACDAIAFMTR